MCVCVCVCERERKRDVDFVACMFFFFYVHLSLVCKKQIHTPAGVKGYPNEVCLKVKHIVSVTPTHATLLTLAH